MLKETPDGSEWPRGLVSSDSAPGHAALSDEWAGSSAAGRESRRRLSKCRFAAGQPAAPPSVQPTN